ncbi:glycosyltransferase family 4 protein [Paenibacillus flagellatus]|uniref:Glycosyl transferase family 1 n=1 Tax=Paenibacillus flagellatus TaxID=2211139 RepID=A0A2V5KMG0_9BACL|nr:glycosyltransferase family 4 protein [Paenibacillus flagellatus]PYI52117.1 glycosyl transferase family 1 [Paenibacillus flagellatus]
MTGTGVYWMGPVYDMGGYGNVSRNYLRALESAGIPVCIHPIGGEHHAEIGSETRRWLDSLSTDRLGPRIVCVKHGTPDFFEQPVAAPPAVKTVGVTLFETDRLPIGWAELCNRMDEIWVPTRFNYATFSQSGVIPSKLRIVPYPIDVTKYYPGKPYNRIVFQPPLRSFSFLYVFGFDFRKGIDLLLQSFCDEFSPYEDVSLVLKVYIHSGYSPAFVMSEICSHIPAHRLQSQIVVIVEPFDEERLSDLYLSCDAYVSTDRAGWGMPAMEMMALGKPAIGLNWGGYTEFMNESNSFLIEPEPHLVPVDDKLQRDRPHYYGNHYWADIRPEKVRAAMREAYANKSKRERIGKKAAFDIHFEFSPEAIGQTIKRLIEQS